MNRSTTANVKARKIVLLTLVLAVRPMLIGEIMASENPRSNQQSGSTERSQKVKLNIKVGSKILSARLADNATARDFVSQLPLNLSMKDLFGREKYGDLPKALSEKGPREQRYEVGDIAYWSPDHQLAVYYHQDGESIPLPGVIPIAKIDGGAEAFNVPGTVKVTIETAK